MAFKRRARGFRRSFRRRRRWEQDRIIQCRTHFDLALNSICCRQTLVPPQETVNIDAFPLLTMTIPFTAAPERYPSTLATRKMIEGGFKFESHWLFNPDDIVQGELCTVALNNLRFFLTIWEAIVILPLAEGSTFAPAYLPVLACASQQGLDLADRVLWKRMTVLPCWGLTATGGFTQLQANIRDTNGGPQVVKVRAAVDDRHGIFMVRQFVHDVFFGDQPIGECFMDVANDLWMTMFYRAS